MNNSGEIGVDINGNDICVSMMKVWSTENIKLTCKNERIVDVGPNDNQTDNILAHVIRSSTNNHIIGILQIVNKKNDDATTAAAAATTTSFHKKDSNKLSEYCKQLGPTVEKILMFGKMKDTEVKITLLSVMFIIVEVLCITHFLLPPPPLL